MPDVCLGRDAGVMTPTPAIDRLLQALLALTLLACAAGTAVGLYVIGQDLETSGEFLDGLGVVIGLAILFLVGVPAALAGWALRLSLRRRQHAESWAIAAAVAGLVLGLPFGVGYRPLLAVLAVPLLLLVVAVEARRARPVGAVLPTRDRHAR